VPRQSHVDAIDTGNIQFENRGHQAGVPNAGVEMAATHSPVFPPQSGFDSMQANNAEQTYESGFS